MVCRLAKMFRNFEPIISKNLKNIGFRIWDTTSDY